MVVIRFREGTRPSSSPPAVERLFTWSIGEVLDNAPFVVILRPSSHSDVVRVCAWLALPLRIWMAERRIRKAGGVPHGRYAVFPNAETPVISYELCTTAARYAEARLLTPGTHSVMARLTSVVSRLVGCHPAIDTVVVAGRRAAPIEMERT